MKRILIILLTLSFVVSSIVFSVSAADFEPVFSNLYNVLEVATANDSGVNRVFFADDGYKVSFDLPTEFIFYYVDIIVRLQGNTTNKIILRDPNGSWYAQLTGVYIGNNTWRYFGESFTHSQDLVFDFTGSESTNVSFLSVKVGTIPVNTWKEVGTVHTTTAYESRDGVMSDADTPLIMNLKPKTSSPSVQQKNTQDWTAYLYGTNWQKYDYMSFTFAVRSVTLASVEAQLGTMVVPIEVSYIDGNAPNTNDNIAGESGAADTSGVITTRWVNATVDIRGFERTSNDVLAIGLTGLISEYGSNQYVSLVAVNGFIETELASPWLLYLRDMMNSLRQLVGAGDQDKSDQFSDDFTHQEDQINDLIGDMESVTQPTLGNIDITNDSSVLNPTALTAVTDWSRLLFGNSFFLRIFTVMMVLATGSYVLFGKR